MSKPSTSTPTACCGGESGINTSGVSVHVPNTMVYTHENRRALFHRDLVKDKIVLLNLMSVDHDEDYPVTANLAELQDLLGDRLGRDVFMYSLTTEPEKDSPEILSAFARRHGARKGWYFLTGEPDKIAELGRGIFAHANHAGTRHRDRKLSTPAALAAAGDCSLGIVRYGNEPAGIWGSVPAKIDPAWIAERINWITPKNARGQQGPRRAGPAPLQQQHPTTARILGNP